jgi:predicted Zn-dependent peptidase
MKRYLISLFVLSGLIFAQDLSQSVTKYTLDNGMRVIFARQGAAPTIAFNLMFDVGGADEPNGLGGIAHMVEHMAFKGTETIGGLDPAEKDALVKVEIDQLALEWLQKNGSEQEIRAQQERLLQARDAATQYSLPAALDDLLSINGVVGLNASTSYDYTSYVAQLPSNRLELYLRIYADVLLNPVFRYFYEERDVVHEERRSRNEDDPQGFLFDAFTDAAFDISPYGRTLIGTPEDIDSWTATKAMAFYKRYYYPNRAVLVLVGDVDPERDIALIEKYFGVISSSLDARPVVRNDPPQTQERRITVEYDAEPQLVIGFHKPTYPHPDAFALDLLDSVLSAGRTSRLFERLVLQDQIALDIGTSSGYPGTRFNNLFLIYALPQAPATTDMVEQVIYEELERIKMQGITEEELQKVKNQVRAGTVRSLASASGLAANLASNELFSGGWENLVNDLEIYNAVTAQQIQDVAIRYFNAENRTVGVLVTKEVTE